LPCATSPSTSPRPILGACRWRQSSAATSSPTSWPWQPDPGSADTKVAEQYFNATSAVEADAAAALTAGAVDDDVPVNRRLLANGHCTRPRELDCRFQTICEGCGFFQTDAEFVPILRRQRDDAASHGDRARMSLYDDLVRIIDEQQAAATD